MNPAFATALRIDRALDELNASAVAARDITIVQLAARYDREKDLLRLAPRLVGKSDEEIRAGLQFAIIAEQQKMRHWSFSSPYREWELQGALLAEKWNSMQEAAE